MRKHGVVLAAMAVAVAFVGGGAGATLRSREYLVVAWKLPSYNGVAEILNDSGHVERVVSDHDAGEAVWSPDRSLIAWLDARGLWVGRADGTDAHLLSKSFVCRFAWSPDGRSLLIGGTGLAAVDVANGRVVQIVRPRGTQLISPVGWSPSGGSVAYVRESGEYGTESCCSTQLVVATAGGRYRRVMFDAAEAIHDTPWPAWSPDGRSIAFVSDSRDLHDPPLGIVDVVTQKLRAVWVNAMIEDPAWSPDSKRLAIATLGPVVTLARSGNDFRSLGPHGTAVAWSSSGEITYVHGARTVYVSEDGHTRAHFLFRGPAKQEINSIDPR